MLKSEASKFLYDTGVAMLDIPDSDVPDILLAFAGGIEQHIKENCPKLTIDRMNSHDIQAIAPAFAPLLVLTLQATFLCVDVGSQHVKLWDHSHVADPAGLSAVPATPARHLSYSDPRLFDQLTTIIGGHFGI